MREAERYARSAALLGEEAMCRLAEARVLVVGVGGVGSWCAEALVRTGVTRLTLVDDDVVVASNLNRQCPATERTLGRPKVEAMRERLLAINPESEVAALRVRYPSSSPSILNPQLATLSSYSCIIDAIDSVDCKAELVLGATAAKIPLVSSMGAALRTDPTRVRVTRFEKVSGDGLARALRQRFKRLERFPAGRFSCVWSAEPPIRLKQSDSPDNQAIPKGSLMPVTATFGMCLASEAIRLMTAYDER